MKRMPFILFLALVMAFASCVKRPEGILSDKKMASLVADIKLAEAYLQTSGYGTVSDSRDKIFAYILEKHGLTREEFDNNMKWYAQNTDAYYEVCDLAEKEMAKKKKKVAGMTSVEIESTDLWPYPRQSYLSMLSGSDAFDFSIPTSDVQKGQRLNLKFRFNNPASGNAILGIEYDDGVKSFITRALHSAKKVDLIVQTDTARQVNRIFGNFLLADSKSMPLWLDSIYLQVQPFDSTLYYNIYSQRQYREPVKRRPVRKEETLSESPATGTVTNNGNPGASMSAPGTNAPAPKPNTPAGVQNAPASSSSPAPGVNAPAPKPSAPAPPPKPAASKAIMPRPVKVTQQ